MLVKIYVQVDDDDEYADAGHPMGISNDAYDRLTGHTEHGPPPLSWLGEVQDVVKGAT